jgi:hypothetical protein
MTQIQLLDDLGAEFARVTARPPRRAPARALAIALGAIVLLAGVAYTVPPTRAAIDDIASSFEGWVGGNEDNPPGRALRPDDDAPDWVRETGGGRVIAETAGAKLFVTRQHTENGTYLMFWLGKAVGMGDTIDGWHDMFKSSAVFVLGAGSFEPKPDAGSLLVRRGLMDDKGHIPFMGVTARSVKRLELRYASGPPLFADGIDGGFVMIIDAWRRLDQLIAYNAAGRELERLDISDWDLRYVCDKEPGICP